MNQKFVVKRQRGPILWILIFASLVMACVAIVVSFQYGQKTAGFDRASFNAQVTELESSREALREKNNKLLQELARLSTGKAVDDKAYQLIEDSLTELNDQLREQREKIAFYERIVSPETMGSEVKVLRFELDPTVEERKFLSAIVLVREGRKDQRVTGSIEVTVKGVQDGTLVTLPWSELIIDSAGASSNKFSFRYFQDFRQEIALPQGFVPELVNIIVKPSGPGYSDVEQSFDWAPKNL